MKSLKELYRIGLGPSSSHTAGAVRIGLTARKLLGDRPVHADISLHGSFALTGHGLGIFFSLVQDLAKLCLSGHYTKSQEGQEKVFFHLHFLYK